MDVRTRDGRQGSEFEHIATKLLRFASGPSEDTRIIIQIKPFTIVLNKLLNRVPPVQ